MRGIGIRKIKKIKKRVAFFLPLIFVIILSVLTTNLLLHYLIPKQTSSYKMKLIVGDHIGVDLSKGMISFGMLTPSGTATRHINMDNSEHKSKVRITAFGKLADLVTVSDNNFVLQPGESKIIDLTVRVPADAEFGDYVGSLKITFR